MNRPTDPRAAYIAVATQKFAEHGYSAVSLDALARQAGVTKQALLHFFGTKERLYAEVLSDLAARVCAEIDACQHPDPVDHLAAYFLAFVTSSLIRPDEARLVLRALLDSDRKSRNWPMKPYLDKLTDLVSKTPGAHGRSREELLAWIFRMIGAAQYFAIASPAISGMYGKASAGAMATHMQRSIVDEVQGFLRAPGYRS